MKQVITRMLSVLLVLAITMLSGAAAEELELSSELTVQDDGGIELPMDYSEEDLLQDEVLTLDDLELAQIDLGGSDRKSHQAQEESGDQSEEDISEQDSDGINGTKYGVPASLTLGVKETYSIKCSKTGRLTYKTSNKKIAAVNRKGIITGKAEGKATVTVYLKGKKLTVCKVKVVPKPKRVSLNKTKLSLKVGRTFQLKPKINSGSHTKYTWSSSKKKVATVSKSGLVTAKSAGTTTITVQTHNGKKATCKVTVTKSSGSTLRVSPTSISMTEGKERDVTVTFTVDGTVRWASSNESVATCLWTSDWSGNDTTLTVYALSAGTATITLTNDANSDTATLKVTVKPQKEEEGSDTLSVNPVKITIPSGESRDATVTFTASGSVTWDSSNESVATCAWASDWSGNNITLTVYGHSAGSATITISNDANSDTATLKVTVTRSQSPQPPEDEGDTTVKYRALLIGEESFDEVCTRNRGDVTLMNNMLSSIKGPAGGHYSIARKYDLNRTAVLNAIRNTFSGADDNDVSLFFIASHGDTSASGSEAGAIAMIDSDYDEQWLLIQDLAAALKAVPGKVIVIIETCGSGAAIYAPGVSENAANATRNAATAFDGAVIRTFSKADPGIRVFAPGKTISKGRASSNTGELRVENKFYVLTASRYQEISYGTEYGPYNYFTKWLTDGIGTSGHMPADVNYNSETTLTELFNYISQEGDHYPFEFSEGTFYQHVQVYPKNSTYPLFKR